MNMLNPADIVREKVEQAIQILQEEDTDLWITFVRETSQVKDPVLDLILGFDLTWPSTLLLHKDGTAIAIVGRYDVENVERLGVYTDVVGYDTSIKEPLLTALRRLKPRQIVVNYSESDPSADGLTFGMFRKLSRMLAATPYCSRLTSAEGVIGRLRGTKSAAELALIRAAIEQTETAFERLTARLEPGMTEREIAVFLHGYLGEHGFDSAWEWDYCPVVDASPDSESGHRMPADFETQRGALLHVDFGVKRNGFAADLQRVWYLLEEGERALPDDVQQAWDAVTAALEAGRAALRPGARGWEVDEAARTALTEAGYPEFMHAFGHHIGRTAHDGATILGPQWERYGDAVRRTIDVGNVFAIELGVQVESRGYLGREENVVVTKEGADYLSTPQEAIWLL